MTSDVVEGNYIGTDANSDPGLGNTDNGVLIDHGADGNTVGGTAASAGNTISDNGDSGVDISTGNGTNDNPANSNVVEANYIGTNAKGTVALPNGTNGVSIHGCNDNTIGGTTAVALNVISGNKNDGVYIGESSYTGTFSSGNLVAGNDIGTEAGGESSLGNGATGLAIDGSNDNVVGGTTAAARNIISGNLANGSSNEAGGVYISDGSQGNVVEGDYIGTDATGQSAIGNTGLGVAIDSSNGNTVGGTTLGAGNVISDNASVGVKLTNTAASSGGVNQNVVEGNDIGTNATASAALGRQGYGVIIDYGSDGNTVGGTTAPARNIISGNQDSGVVLYTGANGVAVNNNVVEGNYIGTNAQRYRCRGQRHQRRDRRRRQQQHDWRNNRWCRQLDLGEHG